MMHENEIDALFESLSEDELGDALQGVMDARRQLWRKHSVSLAHMVGSNNPERTVAGFAVTPGLPNASSHVFPSDIKRAHDLIDSLCELSHAFDAMEATIRAHLGPGEVPGDDGSH